VEVELETLEAIFSRRSVRAFLPEVVSKAQIETIIQAGAAAPSGSNAQRRIFLALRQPQRIAALRALAPGMIGLPPLVIVLCLDRRGLSLGEAQSPSLYMDIGATLQNILLAAHDAGLGACPVASFHPGGVSTFLGLPEGVEACLMVVLGKPISLPGAPPKRRLNEIYFQEEYGVGHANG
jgi:nitroreductase